MVRCFGTSLSLPRKAYPPNPTSMTGAQTRVGWPSQKQRR